MGSYAEERFIALGMKAPDLSFLQKPLPPSRRWGPESLYTPATLVNNWYEDRRAYMRLCPRFTGLSITSTDYVPKCSEKNNVFPPPVYAQRLRDAGQGSVLYKDCEYLENYTTTSDLMHNWELRRAGRKEKPWRKWKLVQDATWWPERDNALCYGNLTQIGYRKAPQVPLLPNDWDVYANNPTTYEVEFPQPRYPDHYVHCRKAASKELRRANEDMIMVKLPDADQSNQKDAPSCCCVCHAIDKVIKECCPKSTTKARESLKGNNPRFGNFVPAEMLKQKPGVQTLYPPTAIWPYRALKHPPHLPAERGPCKPFCLATEGGMDKTPFNRPDICTDYAGDIRQE